MAKPPGWTGPPAFDADRHHGNPHMVADDGHRHRLPSAISMSGGWAVAMCSRCRAPFVLRPTRMATYNATTSWVPIPAARLRARLMLDRRERRLLSQLRAKQ